VTGRLPIQEQSQSYYASLPCKPGALFWRSLFGDREAFDGTKKQLETFMKFPIPNTFLYEGSQSYGLISTASGIEVHQDVSSDSVLDSFVHRNNYQPVAVRKRAYMDDITRSVTVALSSSLLPPVLRGISDLEEFICIQSFCSPVKLSSKAAVLRLSYSPSSQPLGFLLSNSYTSLLQEDLTEKELTEQFCASSETTKQGSLLTYKLVGRSLNDGVIIAKQVYHFIENYFCVRLDNLIVDIVSGKVVQVKGFSLRASSFSRKKMSDPYASIVKICYVCKQGKGELPKFVTHKMISECFSSLSRRGALPPSLSGSRKASDWTTYKCCDICYSLILNEQELERMAQKCFKPIHFVSVSDDENAIQSSRLWNLQHVRLLLGVEAFQDSPLAASIQLSHLDVTVFNTQKIVFGITHSESVDNCAVVELGLAGKEVGVAGAVEIRVFDTGHELVGCGSLSYEFMTEKLSNPESRQLVTRPVFLGRQRWNVTINLGIQWGSLLRTDVRTKELIPGEVYLLADPIRWQPFPEEWIPTMKKFLDKRRNYRRRRSRSRSRSVTGN
jgi:hypothetical protein